MNNFKQYTFKELYDFYHNGKKIKLNTPDGLKNVIGAYQKNGPGLKIIFDDLSEIEGANQHLILKDNEFVALESLIIGDKIQQIDFTYKTIIDIIISKHTIWYDFSLDYEHECYIQNNIIHHNSGKSLMIYLISRWLLEEEKKIIIITPTTALVEQIYKDFADYSSHNGWKVEDNAQKLYSGFSKEFKSNILFTTWQSIFRQPESWFKDFDVVIGDESHLFRAKSLSSLMEKMTSTVYRIGTTGTLDNKNVHQLVLEGLFGPVKKVITTKELMRTNQISELKIKCLLLKHQEEHRSLLRRCTYQEEIDFLVLNKKRNEFICRLALATSGNTLILFQFVEKHGKVLYNEISRLAGENRKVFFISGEKSALEREAIREDLSTLNNAILVASFQTTSTGVNIPSIENIIFASPSKSKIRNLQSIGRGLRLSEGKSFCRLFDIADDLSYKKRINHTLKHLQERTSIYAEEKFTFSIKEIEL